MIASFYQWKIRPGEEVAFRAGWNRATDAYAAMGSLGSSLWVDAAGHFCAFALWPDRAARDQAFASETGRALLAEMAPLVEQVVHKVDLDPLDMRWKPEALAR